MVKWHTVPEIPNYQTSFTPFQGINLGCLELSFCPNKLILTSKAS